MTIYALVVTYNRKDLLCECIDAILAQTKQPDKVVVIDNASTDGTEDLFKSGNKYDKDIIIYRKMEKNTGGAGGFYEGIKYAYSLCDYIWLMDDDTIPYEDTLQGLCESIEDVNEDASFIASSVFGPTGEAMNLPIVDMRPTTNGYPDWYFMLDKKMVEIKSATFVSLLLKTNAVKKCGLPLDWYFIWGDDTEYTQRLTKYYASAYITGKSKVLHKRFNVQELSIRKEENINRVKMYFYFYRNMLLNKREYGSKQEANKFMKDALKECIKIMVKPNVKYRIPKVRIIISGISAYLFGKYDKNAFENRVSEKNNLI